MNTRNALFISVGISLAGSAAFILWRVNEMAPGILFSVAIALVAAFVLSLGAIYLFTRSPMARIEKLGEAMRLLSTGRREHRLEAAEFGELRPLASAYNALASSLSERDDPNLGPVRVTKKLPYQQSSDDNDVGAVRKMKSDKPTPKARQERIETDDTSSSPFDESLDESLSHKKNESPKTAGQTQSIDERSNDAPQNEFEAPQIETQRSEAPTIVSTPPKDNVEVKKARAKRRRKKRKKNSNDTLVERSGLSEDDIRVLFAQFAGALGDEDAPEFGEFAKALREQHDDIIKTHGCKSVRFEVTVVEGNVSLLPRLIR